MDDSELLRRYLDERSETAFQELVGRYIDLVYGAALRQVGGDAHSAKDVSQKVFVALARKAGALRNRPGLTGWLYTCTRLEAAQLVRSERRWRNRGEKAYAMNALSSGDSNRPVDWERLRPVLDEVMGKLGGADREAVLLRFFSGKSFAEVGQTLQVSEEAARKRVDRALEKLRELLGRSGVGSTSAALGMLLTQEAAAAAPAGVASAIASGAWGELAAGAGAGVGTAAASLGSRAIAFMTGTKFMVGVAGAIVAFAAASAVKDAFALRSAAAASAAMVGQLDELARQRDELSRQATALDRRAAALQAARRPSAQTAKGIPETMVAAIKETVEKANLAERHLQYARMFKQLNLSPERVRRLESIMDRENSEQDPKGLNRELHQLLGDDGTKQYYDYKRSVALHNVVDTLAANAYAGSDPFTGAQAEQLFAILIANDANYEDGHGTDVSQVNWDAVWGPAGKVLSAAQLGYFQATVEAQVLKLQVQAGVKTAQGGNGQ